MSVDASKVAGGGKSGNGMLVPDSLPSIASMARLSAVGLLLVVAATLPGEPGSALANQQDGSATPVEDSAPGWDKEAARAAMARAIELIEADDFAAAREHLAEAISLYEPGREKALAHVIRAYELQSLGQLEAALTDAEAAIVTDPGSADGFEMLGSIRADLGDPEAAIAAYDEALLRNAGKASVHHRRGMTLSDIGDRDNALAAFDEAVRLDPSESGYHIDRGNLLVDLGRKDDALVAFADAIGTAENNRVQYTAKLEAADADQTSRHSNLKRYEEEQLGLAHLLRADVFLNAGRDDAALAEYDAALEAVPDHGRALGSRGWLHQMRGEISLARADYERAVRLGGEAGEIALGSLRELERPDRLAAARRRWGNILRDAGRADEAFAAYDDSIRLDPGERRGYAMRGSFHLTSKNYSKAIADMNRVLKIQPGNYMAHAVRGMARFELGDIEAALADLNQSLSQHPTELALTNRGRVHEAMGNTEAARADYEAAVALDPDNSWLKDALQRTE